MKQLSALVISGDPVSAALIAKVAETAGLAPVFLTPGERPRDVLRRLRPAAVVADCDLDPSADAFVGPAMMCGARVGLYCSSSNAAAAARSRLIAERYDVAFFLLPEDLDALRAYFNEIAWATDSMTSS